MSAEFLLEIKSLAHKNNVPIMQDATSEFICSFIKSHNVKSVLEIGTAVGYSAIQFALVDENIKVTTIEIDIDRTIQAIQNVEKCGLKNRIKIINNDALSCDINEKFDLIFIDAAKAQYEKFFEKFKPNLNSEGAIISDNLLFHGIVENQNLTKSYSTKKLVRKIKRYVNFLKENTEFTTEFYKTGDGISVSKFKADYSNFISGENFLEEKKYFKIFKIDQKRILKLFNENISKEFALMDFRNSQFAYNQNILNFMPCDFLKINGCFGIVFKNDDEKFPSRILNETDKSIFSEKFTLLHKKLLSLNAENLTSYKELLLFVLGGNSKENSSVIRKLKKLPEGNFFCHGNFCPENILIDENKNWFASNFILSCKGPKEFDIARSFYILSKTKIENSILKPEDYLIKMKIDKENLLPFIEVFNECENCFSDIF
ncbi:O-methyltransferase [uncultured Treponema sp.]|uniref:O-methyltransferase n=1 Tax=uncultured Treponema sp. TaxID=162155 RepID=UPI0025EA3577|nr:O-methyltransferase [uncultured Treponema sp.]